MIHTLLTIELIDSPVLAIFVAVAAILALVVVLVRPKRRRILAFALGAVIGAGVFVAVVLLLQALDLFDGPLPAGTAPWVISAGALTGIGIVGIAVKPWWRRILAFLTVVLAVLSLGLGVNAAYGITHTLGSILGVDTLKPAVIPTIAPTPDVTVANWKPPADMPAVGTVGTLAGAEAIPTSKPYTARPASVYLPPAALVKNPPKLPVVVAMMGQPGSPDPSIIARELNAYAAAHHGLAPITVIVDQLAGSPEKNPVCHDSAAFGAVSTYVNLDVPAYIRAHFNVLDDPSQWAIAGYSNGGSCAVQWGTEFPAIWGSLLAVSPNKYPGSEERDKAIAQAWGGDTAAYEASLPEQQVIRNAGTYAGHLAAITRGGADTRYGPDADAVDAMLKKAGFASTLESFPGLEHTGDVVPKGFAFVFAQFGAHTGLNR